MYNGQQDAAISLREPSVTYYFNHKQLSAGITTRFVLHVTDTAQTTQFNVVEMRFVVKNHIPTLSTRTECGVSEILRHPVKHNTFDTDFFSSGEWTVGIQALVEYTIGCDQYKSTTPTATLSMKLPSSQKHVQAQNGSSRSNTSEFEQGQGQSNSFSEFKWKCGRSVCVRSCTAFS